MTLAVVAAAIHGGLLARCATAFSVGATAIFLALLHALFHLLAGAAGLSVLHVLALAA